MADDEKQAHIKQRLEAMGVMQADNASVTSPVAPASKNSGFSGLAIMMILAATLTGILIYWLTENSTMHQGMDHTRTKAEIQASMPPTSAAPKHMQTMPSSPETDKSADSIVTSTTKKQPANSSPTTSQRRLPANNTAYRPAYPRYRAYPYPPVPPRYAPPPYQRYYMPPPGYPYPPAPWPPRR